MRLTCSLGGTAASAAVSASAGGAVTANAATPVVLRKSRRDVRCAKLSQSSTTRPPRQFQTDGDVAISRGHGLRILDVVGSVLRDFRGGGATLLLRRAVLPKAVNRFGRSLFRPARRKATHRCCPERAGRG